MLFAVSSVQWCALPWRLKSLRWCCTALIVAKVHQFRLLNSQTVLACLSLCVSCCTGLQRSNAFYWIDPCQYCNSQKWKIVQPSNLMHTNEGQCKVLLWNLDENLFSSVHCFVKNIMRTGCLRALQYCSIAVMQWCNAVERLGRAA